MTDPRLLVAQGEEYFQRGNLLPGNSRTGARQEMPRGFSKARSGDAATGDDPGVAGGAATFDGPFGAEDGLKAGLEEAQAQDLNWNQNWNQNWKGNWDENWRAKSARERNERRQGAGGRGNYSQAGGNSSTDFYDRRETATATANSKANSSGIENPNANPNANSNANSQTNSNADGDLHLGDASRRAPARSANGAQSDARVERFDAGALVRPVIEAYAERDAGRFSWRDRYYQRELEVQRELRVGQGPIGPAGVSREALERIRKREEARAAAKNK
jgi:hypothetical protein